MLGAATVLLAISVILNIITITISSKEKRDKSELKDRVVELEKVKAVYETEIEKNKEIYSADRKAIIAENEAYEVILKDHEDKLAEYTEQKRQYQTEMDNLNNFSREMTPEEFLEIGDEVAKSDSNLHDFTGIYILENKTHDKFYVGQSISLFKRAGNHFRGKGNQDIYEDYMRGDIWTVKLIALADSGFKSINALEKHFIEYHHSTYNGYNRTIGNVN